MTTFALIGAAGYVAKRHFEAIKAIGGDLIAVVDPHDSVGILDKYFPNAQYFREIERFDRFLNKTDIDYVTVVSPNYLHDPHCRMALRSGADVICEKPVVLNPWNLDELAKVEYKTGKTIYPVLQLRLHPGLQKLKNICHAVCHNVQIRYSTPRGAWYKYSWKGDPEKSGGILTNIGIHLFDMVMWIFGSTRSFDLFEITEKIAHGWLDLERARVDWSLSIEYRDTMIPKRFMVYDGELIQFDNVFEDLHTQVYKKIIEGNGFSIQDAKPSIELVYQMRNDGPN